MARAIEPGPLDSYQPPPPAAVARPSPAGRWSGHLLRPAVLLVSLAGSVAVVLAATALDLPDWAASAGATAVTTTYALALAGRAGGHPLVVGALALILSAAAVLTSMPILLASAAVCTATIGAVLGVMVTQPAVRMLAVARECLLAMLVAAVAAFAASAYQAEVSLKRADYLVLALAVLGALGLAYRLAAGLHGLGRRGLAMQIGGIGLLALFLAYTEALSRWGSPELVHTVEAALLDLRELIGAVPRPTVFLLGIPALAWGVSTRARRRQGWWGTGFGAAGLAVVATSLLDRKQSLTEVGLGTAYSLVLGLLLGYLVIRADGFLSGARGRRARRLEEASAHRPEPRRWEPLL